MNERKTIPNKWKWDSQQLLISECMLLFLLIVLLTCHQRRIQGGRSGRSSPLKPTKATLLTMILYNSENNIRDHFFVHTFVTPVLWSILHRSYCSEDLMGSGDSKGGGMASGETSTLGQGGQIAVVGARVKIVKYMTSSCSFNLGTTFLQHSFSYKLRPNPRPPALCWEVVKCSG